MLLCSAGLNRTQVLRAFDESLDTQLKLLSIRKPCPR
jgi:hypothetical protein